MDTNKKRPMSGPTALTGSEGMRLGQTSLPRLLNLTAFVRLGGRPPMDSSRARRSIRLQAGSLRWRTQARLQQPVWAVRWSRGRGTTLRSGIRATSCASWTILGCLYSQGGRLLRISSRRARSSALSSSVSARLLAPCFKLPHCSERARQSIGDVGAGPRPPRQQIPRVRPCKKCRREKPG